MPSDAELTIVTLTRDNTAELALTLRSVNLQTRKSARHIVVDGSRPENSSIAKTLAKRVGAEYHWREPRGIYDAMDYSVSLLDQGDYVIWLNSSDWLAGPRVLEYVYSELEGIDGKTSWIIGQLLRRGSREIGLHKYVSRVRSFSLLMALGFTGFPHPSTVFSVESLVRAGGFSEGADFKVARDYDLALRLLRQFGEPKVCRAILAVHVPDGFTSEMRMAGFLERFQSRMFRLTPAHRLLALLALGPVSCLAVYRRFSFRREFRGHEISPENILGHYCQAGDDKNWPFCCDLVLDVGATYPNLSPSSYR